MDRVKLYVILFAISCVLSMCMALDCDWKREFMYRERCESCPPGEFPKRDSHGSLCQKCTGVGDHCFCNNTLCKDNTCSKCVPSPRCEKGKELRRTGYYSFTYLCIQCQNQTYNDEEDKMCKPISNCSHHGLHVIFPGNMTHDAKCGCPDCLVTHNGLVVCLAIILVAFLTTIIYLCIQRTREKRVGKKYASTSNSLKVPCDECSSYKLSKEEMGV